MLVFLLFLCFPYELNYQKPSRVKQDALNHTFFVDIPTLPQSFPFIGWTFNLVGSGRSLQSSANSSHLCNPFLHAANCLPALQEAAQRAVQTGLAMQRLQLQRSQEVPRKGPQRLHW